MGWAILGLLAGCQSAPPRYLDGRFQFDSEGEVVSFLGLADQAAAKRPPAKLAISAFGNFRADASRSILTLSDVQLYRMSGGKPAAAFREPAAWAIRIRDDGFEADQELTPEKQWISKCLASYWTATVPALGEQQVQELDGRNTVRISQKGSNSFRKWLSREPDRPDLETMPNREAIEVEAKVAGQLRYEMGSQSVGRIEGQKVTVSSVGRRRAGENVLRISIYQEPAETPTPPFTAAASYPLAEASRAAENETELQRKYLEGANLETLLKRADSAGSSKERNAVFLSLRALFYLQPAQCREAVNQSKSVRQADLVAEALAGCGNSQGQDALLPLLDSAKGETFRNRLSFLIPMTRLTPRLENALLGWAIGGPRPVQEQYMAQLVVGSNIRRSLAENPRQAKRLSDELARALTQAETEDQRHNLLYALGNAGNPELLPVQLGYLQNPSPVLRRAAAHSLRHLLDDRVRTILRARKDAEPESQVRQKIDEVLAQP